MVDTRPYRIGENIAATGPAPRTQTSASIMRNSRSVDGNRPVRAAG